MIGCLVPPPWLFSDPEDGGGNVPAPRINGLTILVRVGWSLGRRSDPWPSLTLGRESDPEGHEDGDEKKADHVSVVDLP